jgi:hypothetical protein
MKFAIITAILVLLITGCKSTKTIYHHGGYPNAVYQYLKNDELSIEQQIQMVSLMIEEADNDGKAVMPGVHAHLGLLYFDSGNPTLGLSHFTTEKTLFPESSTFLDFLMSQMKQGSAVNE